MRLLEVRQCCITTSLWRWTKACRVKDINLWHKHPKWHSSKTFRSLSFRWVDNLPEDLHSRRVTDLRIFRDHPLRCVVVLRAVKRCEKLLLRKTKVSHVTIWETILVAKGSASKWSCCVRRNPQSRQSESSTQGFYGSQPVMSWI